MPELKLKQMQFEADTWKRLLGFLIEENIHLKNRLSEILKNNFDKKLLEEVENFQNRFMKEDNLVSLLRNDVAEFDKLILREVFEDGQLKKEVVRKVKTLRRNIENAEAEFSKLKTEFNNYLSENI